MSARCAAYSGPGQHQRGSQEPSPPQIPSALSRRSEAAACSLSRHGLLSREGAEAPLTRRLRWPGGTRTNLNVTQLLTALGTAPHRPSSRCEAAGGERCAVTKQPRGRLCQRPRGWGHCPGLLLPNVLEVFDNKAINRLWQHTRAFCGTSRIFGDGS